MNKTKQFSQLTPPQKLLLKRLGFLAILRFSTSTRCGKASTPKSDRQQSDAIVADAIAGELVSSRSPCNTTTRECFLKQAKILCAMVKCATDGPLFEGFTRIIG